MSALDVQPYSVGLIYASVCCLATENLGEIEREMNAKCPTGVAPWRVSADPTFANGDPNPRPCERGAGRIHVLMEC